MGASRYLCLLLLSASISIVKCTCTFAQKEAGTKVNTPVKVEQKRQRLDSLLSTISKQANVVFSLNTKVINLGRFITLGKTSYTLETLLYEITNQFNLSFVILQNHIILSESKRVQKNELATSKNKISTVSQETHPLTKKGSFIHETPSKITIQGDSSDKLIRATATPTGLDTIENVNSKSVVLENKKTDVVDIEDLQPSSKQLELLKPKNANDSLPERKRTRASKIKLNPLLAISFTSDEVFYVGAQTKIGVTYLHGVLSINTNLNASQFRYGIGSSVKISKHWFLNVMASTGKLGTRFSDKDSIGTSLIKISTSFDKLGVLLEHNIKDRLSVSLGLSLNSLSKVYTLNERAEQVYSATGKRYEFFNPPGIVKYTKLSGKMDSNLTWIGCEFSLSFKLVGGTHK
jgi:hypothetical protein